jgi:hypothetical protein
VTDRELKSVEIEGYASIRAASVSLGRLNVLVGANGAGKSNFVRVFELLGRLAEEDLGYFVGLNGGASALLTSGADRLRIVLDGAPGRYEVELVPAGAGASMAGVMMRSTSSSAIFAALSCDTNGQLWFHRRPSEDRTSMRMSPGPKVELPGWIRLQKREQQIVASYSSDGRIWQRVGSDTTKWKADRSWREDQEGIRLLRGAIGVYAASLSKSSACTARLAQVTVALDGLRAEYFAGNDFDDLRVARLDPQVDFKWESLPESTLVKDRFSGRWTGQLLPRRSGEHRFMLEANGAARLWVEGRPVDVSSAQMPATGSSPVLLTVGTPADIRVEFQSTNDAPALRLGWQVGERRETEIIPMTNFLSRFSATNTPEGLTMARASEMPAVRGIWLRDGSFIAAPVTFADESAVHIPFAGQKAWPILNAKIAGIVFRPRQQSPFEIAQGRSGLILRDGDFLEGDFQRIERGQVSVGSVLFGVKRFRIEGGEPIAVVLNEPTPSRTAGFRVRLMDGSVLNVTTFSPSADRVTVEQPLLGRVTLPIADLLEVERALAAKAQPGARQP